MNQPLARHDGTPGRTALSVAHSAWIRGVSAADMDLGANYFKALRRMLERALLAAHRAERRVAEQQKEIERLKTLSMTDENTGLLNRRGFLAALERAMARGRRFGEPAVLLLIDLDDFKAVNDTHGHAAGDYVLSTVAFTLRRAVRAVDDVARVGGDEFAVIANQMPHELAVKHARTIECVLNGVVASWNGVGIRVRASVGSHCFGADLDHSVDEIYRRADTEMYHRKRGNRAVAAD